MSRVCAICGVGPGIGFALARRFAREGFAVALLARRQDALDTMAEALAAEGGTARGFAVDLVDVRALGAALTRVAAEMGAPNALIYNASGAWDPKPMLEVDPDAFAAQLGLCVTGAFVAAQTVAPAMRAEGGGAILLTGGGLALAPEHGGQVLALTAGKAALRALAFAMAPELAAGGVRVAMLTIAGLVAPGTPFDPDRIAEAYWRMYAAPAGGPVETVFRGA